VKILGNEFFETHMPSDLYFVCNLFVLYKDKFNISKRQAVKGNNDEKKYKSYELNYMKKSKCSASNCM
jgi:hypothetical protein